LQQEAAQMTAELAGLEERRRGAEAAFQRIDRLLPIWSGGCRRSSSSAPRRRRARAAHQRERRAGERQKELTEARAEALAAAQTLASRRRRCASSWPRWRRN
jgi:chromosome segregation protein